MPIPQLNKTYKSQQSWRKLKNTKSPKKRASLKKSSPKRRKNKDNYSSFFANFKRKIILSILFLLVLSFLVGSVSVAFIARGLPDPNKLMERELAQTTKIYDRTGETVLYEIHGDQQRTLVNLEEIPEYIKWASISIEDKNFYKHNGVSVWGILRGVVWQKLRGKPVQGGSTLTQQFIKNAVLTNERTITRKVKEWILAYKLEQKFSKDEILQLYLNEIPYGSTAYGIEAASQKYFAKSARDISLAEAAILAALPQAPTAYSPYGNNKDHLIVRQHYILDLMVEQNYVSKEDAEIAKNFELVFKKQTANIKAPHFVMYIKELLSEKYGEKMIEQDGLKITTTLDLYKQEVAEEIITELGDKNNENYQATNSALVSIDPKTGQILAMVGSRDYFNDKIDGQVNITTSLRQPGSSMKPLIYASTFLKGLTPSSILYDVVTNFSQDKENPYEPHNYTLEENGPVSIRKALAGSLNIPAVKALYIAGVENVLDLAKNVGYTSLGDKDRFGLSLVLGGAEVRLIEHTNAYSAFAREGNISPITSILKIEDKDGVIIEEWKEDSKKVLDPKVARAINDILSDNNARSYAFGENNWLTLGDRPVAAKTGTTNDYRDAWTIGYTPSLVTGVWVGNNNNDEMKRGAAGGVVAAPIWNSYMKRVLGDTPKEEFNKFEKELTGKAILDGIIEGKKTIKIDTISGLLATDETPEEFIEEITLEEHHSILHYIDKKDPLGKIPEKPEKDSQYLEWEEKIRAWAEKISSSTIASIPTEYDNIHSEENKPALKITSPKNKTKKDNLELIVTVETSAPRGVNHVNYYIDNYLISKTSRPPFSLNENISYLKNGEHTLRALACDDVFNCQEDEIKFNLNIQNNIISDTIKLELLEPSNGLAVSNFDFPLKLKTQNDNSGQVAVINYYFINDKLEKIYISSNAPVKSTINEALWIEAPVSGTYKIFAESTSWTSQVVKTNESLIIINNTLDMASSAETIIE
ncbi:MAG: PBP1A family penicillin-binding protein [Patescibacteria group bacterium]|jgi:1A family penicillin-binding protein|nr:PBP1A family penicillin-binding protein [Patescibacteria group bacterium]